jgi:hypothetical protein
MRAFARRSDRVGRITKVLASATKKSLGGPRGGLRLAEIALLLVRLDHGITAFDSRRRTGLAAKETARVLLSLSDTAFRSYRPSECC